MKTFLIFATLLFQSSLQVKQDTLKVSVYYESLCPDSIRFITSQLHPSYSKIGTSLELDLVPYGKATHNLLNGKWVFDCQHGERECQGNKYQACGLAQDISQQQKIDFVDCIMGSFNPSSETTVINCASKFGLSGNDILECGKSQQGDELLAKYGDQTHAVQPKITFVPTIIFNDVYDVNSQWSAIFNFISTACKFLENKPSGCH
ncbi:hypothetical protein FQA39_LY17840 [Lamprigera yunnana]|nr:hypothetical protein FQA39_LY17840 [Lamprigera yunnana]